MQEYSYSYTKHIYAGTQRIASKVGDIEAFGADPRRVEYAGANLKEVDLGAKYKKQTSAFLARYDSLGVMNKPRELNDYVGGQSFCCGEKELVSNNQTGDNTFETPDYEQLIFFYHPDHLGSTSLVTDNSGNVVQSVAYIPYGEVFIEERNGTWNTPYLFNGKELDEETGLYYYGARYLNPTNCMWLSTDPLFEKNIDASPYSYCHGNPVKLIDPDGRDEIYYREDGTEISRITCKEDVKYVLRTLQTTGQMYRECSPTEKGNSNHIHPGDADIAENLIKDICNPKFEGFKFKKEDVQEKYFVKAPNQEEFDAAMKFIGDDGTGGRSDDNNREYAFNLLENEVRIGNKYVKQGYLVNGAFEGKAADASTSTSVSTAYRDNHTHPSGVGSKGHKWQQAPSATDISNSSTYIRRVWGMGNKTIYMFNKEGVQATIPFSVYRR